MTWIPPEVKSDNSSSQPSWTPPEVKKKEEPVSVGDSQSLDIPVVSTQEEVATHSATLSFQEQQKKAPDFMGLISEGYKEQPSGVIKSVSEGLSKAERPVEDKFASYVDEKRKELTGGLNLPNPLTVQDHIQYQQQLNDYTRVLRENPMAVKEENKITAIRMLIDQTKNADRVLQDYSQQNIAERVGTGVKKGFEDYGRGYTELFDRLKQNSAIKELNTKIEALDKGEDVKLDEGDKILAQSLVENGNKIKQLEAINPTAYNIGKIAGESLGFTGEFLLTGGVGAGLAKSITKGVAAKVAEGATVSAAKKLGVGLSAKMAQTGLQVAAMPTFYKGIAEDVSKGENFGESLLKNYYKTFSENFTERIFLKNPWSKGTVGTVDGFMSKLGVNMHTEKGLAGIFASTAEEVAEEKIGEIMTAPLDYNNFNSFWKDYWDVQKNGELIGSVAMMTVPMGLVSYSAKKYDDVQLNRIGKLLPSGVRLEIDQVLDDKKLTLKEQYDLVGKIVEDNATNKTLGDNPAEAAGNIIRYTQQKTKSNVVSAVEERAKAPIVGTMEEITTEDQAKLDYLESKGVTVPDGSSITTVNNLYEEEKQKEPSVVGEEVKTTEIKPTDAISEPVEETKAEEAPITPTEGEKSLKQTKIEELDGSIVSYDGTRGRLVKTDRGYVVEDKEGNRTFVESGESGMSAEELGLFKEKDVPTYNPEDSSIDYLGNKYQYESVNVDKDGNTQSVNVIDDKGNKKTIRDKFVVEEIEYQKALSELDQSGRLSEITDEDIDNSLKELNIKEYGQEPTQPKAEEVQQAGQGKVAETLTAEKTGQIAPTVVGEQIQVEQQKQLGNGKESRGNEAQRQRRQERLLRVQEIDAELGDVWSDLADIVGAKISLTGEQRAKIMPVVSQLAKLYTEKYALKGMDLVDQIIEHFTSKGIELDEETTNQISQQYAEGIRKQDQGDLGTQKGVDEGKKREIPVGDNGKDKKTPRGKDEKVSGETKQRGTQTSTLTKAGGIWERLAKEAPLFYEVRKESEAIANAVKWLSEREESTIQNALGGRKSGTPWERMDRRMIYMMYLKEKMSSFIEQGKTEEANAVWENIKKIEEAVAKEGTEAGWTVQALAKFKRLDDISTTFVINNEIAKHNQSLYPETDIKKVSESEEDINKLSKEIVNEAVDDEKLTNVVNTIAEKNKGKKRTETYSEKAKEIADKLRKVKSSNWGITLAADPISSIGIGVLDGAVETTAKAIELSGNIVDSINKGINQIKRSDWYKGLNGKQKRHIERAFELNVKKDIGVDALDRATLEKYLKREMKDLGVSLKYIIKEHWANPTAFGTKLSDRIVANLGLTEAEAKLVEKTVNDIIRQKLEDKITNSILNESLPKSKAQKEIFLNKMGEFLMMGNIEHKYFREAFAEKFGLTPDITAEQVDYLTRLNKAVDATKDMGVYGDIVANQLAQEIDKLIPRTKIQELLSTMVGLDYVNALSGYTTSYINIKSVFWNLLTRPIMDVTDGAEWIKSIKNGKPSQMPIANMFNSWVDFFSMTGKSYSGLIDVLKSGDLRAMHKYISEVKSVAHLKVPEMERQKYGKDRFKPITINVNGKNIDINATNYTKFVGRFLAGQDLYFNSGFDAVELANALRKKMRAQGFTESQIKEQIQRQVYGWNLTEKEQQEVDDQLAKEKEGLKRFGFTTDKYKDNRRRLEIIREKLLDLEEQDILDLKEVAKGNVFNDARGGVVNAVMSSLSRFANKNIWTKLGIMPHFMFFTITGNIGDFMIDTIPAYGSLRARGVTPTTIAAHYSKYRADGMSIVDATRKATFGARLYTSELPFKTAMLGDKGSYRREQQLARARLGNMIMLSNFAVIAGLYAIGGDDKDENGEPWFDISGGRWDVKDVTKREQELMPPYTIKIGDYKFRYGNAPILTFGMSMVGNYRDMINAGVSDEEAMQRMILMSRSYAYSIASLTDQQLMQGFKSITQSVAELWKTGVDIKKEDETGESQAAQKIAEKFGKYIVKEQLSPFTGWLPTKNNAFQQSIQFISKKAVESKDIPSMLAYDLGIHQFTNRTALDRFGDDVKRKPGYTGIYWEPEMITSDPKKWEMVRWLQTNNSFPASYYNRDERFVYDMPKSKGWLHDLMGNKKPVVELKAPTEDQFYEMRKLEGNMLKKDLMRYKDATYEGKPIWEREAKEQLSSGETVMQQKVKKYISEAKQQTKLYLFTWADIGKKDPTLFKQLYESKSLPQYETKVPVFKRDLDGGIYKDENGEYVVKIKQDLVSDQLALFNAEAFRYYMKLMKEARTTDTQELKQLSDVMWKVAVQTKAAEYKGE